MYKIKLIMMVKTQSTVVLYYDDIIMNDKNTIRYMHNIIRYKI